MAREQSSRQSRRHWGRGVSLGVLMLLVGGISWAATQAEGFVTPEPDLHDAGVWVTRGDERRLGRTNTEINTVDTSLAVASSRFDVLQARSSVFVRQFDPSMVLAVDPALAMTIPGPELPDNAVVALGGSTAVVYDPGTGVLIITEQIGLLGVDLLDPSQHSYVFDGAARVAVGDDGTVYALDLEHHRLLVFDPEVFDPEVFGVLSDDPDAAAVVTVVVETGGNGESGDDAVEEVEGLEIIALDLGDDDTRAELTVVGSVPVVLVVDTGRLIIDGHHTLVVDEVAGLMPVLQRPGPAASRVLMATDTTWWQVPLDGRGDPEPLLDGGEGMPAVPVVVGGCAFGAWNGNGLVARACVGGEVLQQRYEEFATSATLTWRVNRDRVVLNEMNFGRQLIFGDGDPVYVDEWAEAFTDEPELAEDQDDLTPEVVIQQRDRSTNDPPVANDTVVGTRQGRPLVINPLRNDFDPDGDVLVIEPLAAIDPEIGRITRISDNQEILLELDPNRTQAISFPYTITDGFGHTASATVTVNIVPDTINTAPEVSTNETTTVVTGGTVVHDVVANAFDPEGDPISLVSVTTEAGEVRYDNEGLITFTATNEPGTVEVIYTLSDDLGAESIGILEVTVVPREVNEPPVARNVHATTFVGRELTLDAMANDTDANGDLLSLVRVESLTGTGTLRWDPTSPDVRFTSTTPGSYNFLYRITDGRDTAEALIRIDVVEPASSEPPVAVRDDVVLTAGVPAYVDVLANDIDPDGDVLTVTGITLPQPSPVDVEILQRSILRISADVALDASYEFDYHITDGVHQATGRVIVTPAPVRDRSQPPVVGPDEYTVRAGGIAYLPVLDNDYDPDGGPLELLAPDPVDDLTAARQGRLFRAGNQLRFEAPATPSGTIVTSTTVMDSQRNTASGQLVIHVIEPSGERNNPPHAPTLVARVNAGDRVAIPVPLATMDPDGDIVSLMGIASGPRLGAVIEVGHSELIYQADPRTSGTDEFTYRVRDQFGLEATGAVLVGVVGEGLLNADPVALDDEVNVMPGSTVIVPALANDYDPDGGALAYSDRPDDLPNPAVGSVAFDSGQMLYTAPEDAQVGTSTSFAYSVTDGRGGRASAVVTVRFVDEIPNRPPEPVDVLIDPQRPGVEFTTAPLQDNDLDPDGDVLRVVSISYPDAQLNDDGTVTMTMPERPVQFTYEVTDGIETRRAAVVIPLADNLPPVTNLSTATVISGEQVTIDVLANDFDPDGNDLVLLDVLGVRHGTVEIVGDQVVFTASEEGYYGTGGFVYMVADSVDPAEALIAYGVAQVEIESDGNIPPQFTTLQVDVPLGGEESLDLALATTNLDPSQTVSFTSVTGQAEGVDASISGSTMTVTVAGGAEIGTFVELVVAVTDGVDTVEGFVEVTVVASDQPLAQAVADTAQTVQGVPVTIPVLDNDVNPFPEVQLAIVGVTQVDGATITTDGTVIEVAPDPDRRDLGQIVFEYTVADATGDPARNVTGTVTVTVIGRPDIAAAPTCIGGESRSVQIGWAAPSANGAQITEYQVRISVYPTGGGSPSTEIRTFSGGSTVQTIGGLQNGLEHTFEVAAINEAVIDDPEFSEPSPRCVPDQVPDQPEPPQVTFGDGELYLTFSAPPVDGTPVREMTLLNTTTGQSTTVGPTVTDYTWTGLENGTSYRFTLIATNERGDSDPSPPSTGDGIPAGAPLSLVAPSVDTGDRLMTVNWSQPNENGDPIVEYEITIIRSGSSQGTVSIPDGSRRSVQIDTDNAIEYQFRLRARNKAGWSETSGASATAVSAGRPFPVSSVSATEGNTTSQLSFDEPFDNGAAITSYQVSVNGGSWNTLAGDRVVRNLTNGQNYSFRIRAVNSEGTGDPSPQSNQVNPYGNPTTPGGLQASDNGSTTITWRWDASDGNGRSIDRYEVSLNNGSWQSVGTSREYSHTVSTPGGSAQLRVRARSTAADSDRQLSDIAGPRSHSTPQPEVNVSFTGQFESCDTAPDEDCQRVSVQLRNHQPNSNVTVTCRFNGWSYYTYDISTNSSGNGQSGGICHIASGPNFSASTSLASSRSISW